jgi:hypothetical protein
MSVFKLFGLNNMKSFSIFIDTFNILISSGIIIIIILTFLSKYVLTNEYLIFKISVMKLKIPIKDIQLIRQDSITCELCLYYVKDKENSIFNLLMITIKDDLKEKFIKDLKEKNNNIVFELIDKSKDENS